MENTNVQEVKMPITYDDLKKSLVDSGRPYDFAMIDRAYALAEKAHGEQRRRSGEPYICHPLSVAQILVELGMDSESIAAALMHDVAEDTPVTVAEIKQKFGPEVALLVDGVTKLTQIKFSNVEDRQAENLRKMLLAMIMVFIRGPIIEAVGPEVEILAQVNGAIVAAREKQMLVTSFHPELTGDERVHAYFLDMINQAKEEKQ